MPRVVGVDEFAQRRGSIYGTVLVDVETRRPIDLLPDREANTLAAWLAERPGIEIVCRDRAPFFAEGATRGAPQAIQIADRWHLWHNLGEAAEKCVYRHRGCLRPVPERPDERAEEAEAAASSPWPTGHRFAERTRAKHATIHALLDAGHSKRSVARQLGMTLNAILRFSRATTPEELFTGQWQSRATKLDAYKPYLAQRWQKGCTNAWKLWEEIREQGYPDGYGNVRNYVSRTLRRKPQPVGPRPPSACAVTRWILTHPDALVESDRIQLKAVLVNCPELDVLAKPRAGLRPHGHRPSRRPTARVDRISQSLADLPSHSRFAHHLERDLDAVVAGLSQPWNSGVVEGHVNLSKCSSVRCSAAQSSSSSESVSCSQVTLSAGLIRLPAFVIDPAGHHAEDEILKGVRHRPEAGDPSLDKPDLTALIDT